jgi:hypothetical protein
LWERLQPRDQFAAAVAVEEAGVQPEQVRVQAIAHVGDHALAQQGDEIEARRGRQRQRQRDQEQEHEGAVDVGTAGKALVDHPPERDRQAQRRGRGAGQRQQPGDEQAAMCPYERPQCAQGADRGFGGGRFGHAAMMKPWRAGRDHDSLPANR